MCLFCVCAVLCLGRGLATDWSLVQGVLAIVNGSGNWKATRAHKGCRAIKKISNQMQIRDVSFKCYWIPTEWTVVDLQAALVTKTSGSVPYWWGLSRPASNPTSGYNELCWCNSTDFPRTLSINAPAIDNAWPWFMHMTQVKCSFCIATCFVSVKCRLLSGYCNVEIKAMFYSYCFLSFQLNSIQT
jgi:hypothetical protein